MSKVGMQFKIWGQGNKKSSKNNHTDISSNALTEQENRKHNENSDRLQWNYTVFTPSDDPKYSNGTKATTLRSGPRRSRPQQSEAHSRKSLTSRGRRTGSKRQRLGNSSSSSDSDDPSIVNLKPTRRAPNSSRKITLPLLRNSYQLKYVLEGHSHLSQQIPTRQPKKTKRKKKVSSSKRRGRSSQETRGDDDADSESGNTDADEDSDDENSHSLDIWSCEFEPSNGTSSTTVALCGGSSILFLDTQQGRYVKKYSHPEPLECFYTLAWTLLHGSRQLGRNTANSSDSGSNNDENEGEDDDTYAAILAAAGKFGSIKLLEPTQTHCYRYLFGHQQPVLKVNFSKKDPRWLLSSSMDMTVRLWDIGTPNNEIDDSSCLAHFTVPGTSHPTSMSLSYGQSLLIVGTNKADLLQYETTPSQIKKWQQDTYKAKPASNTDEDDNRKPKPTIVKPKLKFPHGGEWHEGYVEDVHILGQDGSENEVTDYIVSRGSNDMEILMWNPKTSTKTDADIHLSLEWPESDDCTGMRFTVVEKDGQKLLLGGDHDGDIRLFNIGDGKCSKTLQDGSKELFDPLKVFTHEASTHLIRDICISWDTRKFVAVDSNNTVFVWSCN